MPSSWRLSSLVPDGQNPWLPQPAPKGFETLVDSLGWPSIHAWSEHWHVKGGLLVARDAWPVPVDDSWVAHLALPFLSRIEQALDSACPTLLGVSALPGCGKTTLCSWAKHASDQLGWRVEHLSLDDFYWPAQALEQSMAGNPWQVARALPGSHDLKTMDNALRGWRQTGRISAPRFDKSLRQGRGDRVGSTTSEADVVLLEGWFLGVSAQDSPAQADDQVLSEGEQTWRPKAIHALSQYTPIWEQLDDLWHLRAIRGDASSTWKEQQLVTLRNQSGVDFSRRDLSDFNRMVQTALPMSWMQELDQANVVVDLNNTRGVEKIHRRETQLSASSASATG